MVFYGGILGNSTTGKLSLYEIWGAVLALLAFLSLYYFSGYIISEVYTGCYDAYDSWFCQRVLSPITNGLMNIVEPIIFGFISLFIVRYFVKTADYSVVFTIFSVILALFFLGSWVLDYIFDPVLAGGYEGFAFSLIYTLMAAVGALLGRKMRERSIPETGRLRASNAHKKWDTDYFFCAFLILHASFYISTTILFNRGGDWSLILSLGMWLLVALTGIVLLHASRRRNDRSQGDKVIALVVAYVMLMVPLGASATLGFLFMLYS